MELLDHTRPDVILIDNELHPEIIAAHGRGHRVALLSSMMPSMFGLRAPPLNKLIVPGMGFPGSPPGLILSWGQFWGWTASSFISTAVKQWGGD